MFSLVQIFNFVSHQSRAEEEIPSTEEKNFHLYNSKFINRFKNKSSKSAYGFNYKNIISKCPSLSQTSLPIQNIQRKNHIFQRPKLKFIFLSKLVYLDWLTDI